jgi:hypothetical protein
LLEGLLGCKEEVSPLVALGTGRRRLAELSAADLRARADGYFRMAATATTREVMSGLLKLAERFNALADDRERHK